MANAKEGNVIYVDTDDTTLASAKYVEAIKYIGNTSGTATIKAGTSSGDLMWEESGTANVFNEVCIHSPDGLHVAVTNGAKVYIYLK